VEGESSVRKKFAPYSQWYLVLGLVTVYLIYAETTPRQREPRDAATDAETRTISDSIDRSLTRDTCDGWAYTWYRYRYRKNVLHAAV